MVRAKRVVPVEVLEAVVQDDKELSAGLRDPMEAAVNSGGLRDVVVLDQIDPRDRRGKDEIRPQRHEAHDEITLGEGNIVEVVADRSPKMYRRCPGQIGTDQVPGAVIERPGTIT